MTFRGVRGVWVAALAATFVVSACGSGDSSGADVSGNDAGGTSTTGDDASSAAGPDGGGVTSPDASTGGDSSSQGTPDAAEASTMQGCGAYASDTANYVCAADGNSRVKCVSGSLVSEACANGCLREPSGQDAVCMGTTTNFSCTGSWGTERAQNGDYYLTSFGCWTDTSGTVHTDPGDNCIPSCLSKATSSGVCMSGASGPTCEESVDWFTADGGRFGCMQRLRITNPANGKAVIAVALDYGPGCSVENSVSHAVLDASGRIDQYLFGGDQGASDKALVHVVEVDNSTPLGPI